MYMSLNLIKRKFIFIRHGETEGNVHSLCQGHIDYPLTPLGREQAVFAAEKIKKFLPIQRLYSSDLGRAEETAKIISDKLHIKEIIFLKELRERKWGDVEGLSNVEMFKQEEQEKLGNLESLIRGLELKPEFLKRIEAVMNQILNIEEQPVIVGHGRFFFTLCDLLEIPPVQQIPNGSPILCSPKQNKWIIDIY
jgi:broad specificity phosphatase PhoE